VILFGTLRIFPYFCIKTKIMEYKNELRIIDSEQKSYFLGMLFADGVMTIENAVKLSLIDEQIINDLALLFPFFNKGNFDYSKYNLNAKIQYSLSKKSEELQKDLINNGLQFRKSTENLNTIKIPNINNQLIPHFIRGYFDGNGSISIPSRRPNLRRIEICSTSITFIEDIKNYLLLNSINCPILREKKSTNTSLFLLEWVNSEDTIKLREFLYKDATVFLKRKKELFDSFTIVDKTDNNPKCVCGQNLVKNGKRQMAKGLMLRYKCERCNKNYTFPKLIKISHINMIMNTTTFI